MKRRIAILIVLLFAGLIPIHAEEQADPLGAFEPPEGLDEGWYARIETSMGRVIARMLPEQAPQSVAHFAALAEGELKWEDPVSGEKLQERYFDGVRVYRAEAGRRVEAGDINKSGRRPPVLFVPPEGYGPVNFDLGYRLGNTGVTRGRLSATQFFMTSSGDRGLTGLYPCFGVIVKGREAVKQMTMVKTYSNGRPIDSLWIEGVRMFAVGNPDPLPEPVTYWPKKFEIRQVD